MQIGQKLFNFTLPATNGEDVNNYTLADRNALLIIVSCNHCPYARAYWSRIRRLYNKYEEDNLGLLVISGNDSDQYPEDSFERMKELNAQQGDWLTYLYDEDQEVLKKLRAMRTPEAFLFNSKRELVYRGAIDDCWENEHMVTRVYLEDAIEYTLDGLEVDFPEVPAVGCSIKWKPGNEPQND